MEKLDKLQEQVNNVNKDMGILRKNKKRNLSNKDTIREMKECF
jgi:hypothetical protein